MKMHKFKVSGTIEVNFTKIVTVYGNTVADINEDSFEEAVQAAFDRGEEDIDGFDMSEPVDVPNISSIEEVE